MFSPSRAEIGESGFSRYDVPAPPSSASSLVKGTQVDNSFNKKVAVKVFPSGSQVMLLKAIREELTGCEAVDTARDQKESRYKGSFSWVCVKLEE